MEILIKHKSQTPEQLKKHLGDNYLLFDLTSKGSELWIKFSPFYPHGDIPVPFSPGLTAQSVEGIWQGLKVFENTGIDIEKFQITTMQKIKRRAKKFGKILGHQKGVTGKNLLNYRDARSMIYLPCYRWVLENKLQNEITLLREKISGQIAVFLDYEINPDPNDLKRPLSHASLVKAYLEGRYPE